MKSVFSRVKNRQAGTLLEEVVRMNPAHAQPVAERNYRHDNGIYGDVVIFKEETFKTPRLLEDIPAFVQEASFLSRIADEGLKVPAFKGLSPDVFVLGMETVRDAVECDPHFIVASDVVDGMADVIAGVARTLRPGEADDVVRCRTGRFMPQADLAARVRAPDFLSLNIAWDAARIVDAFNAFAAARPSVAYHADIHSRNILVRKNNPGRLAAVIDFGRIGVGPVEMSLLEMMARSTPECVAPLYRAVGQRLSQESDMRDLFLCAAAGAVAEVCKELTTGFVSDLTRYRAFSMARRAQLPQANAYAFGMRQE